MSRFYASIEGQAATEATRAGSANSGISSHTRGWHVGVRVTGIADGDEDEFHVYLTGGSNMPVGQLVGKVRMGKDGPVFEAAT